MTDYTHTCNLTDRQVDGLRTYELMEHNIRHALAQGKTASTDVESLLALLDEARAERDRLLAEQTAEQAEHDRQLFEIAEAADRWVWKSWTADAAERRIESVLRARSRRAVRRARKAAQR